MQLYSVYAKLDKNGGGKTIYFTIAFYTVLNLHQEKYKEHQQKYQGIF